MAGARPGWLADARAGYRFTAPGTLGSALSEWRRRASEASDNAFVIPCDFMTDDDLLEHFVEWYASHVSRVRELGIELALNRSPAGRPKAAVWVTGRRETREAELILWETGEAEFSAGTPGIATANEHHELRDTSELDVLLDRLLSLL